MENNIKVALDLGMKVLKFKTAASPDERKVLASAVTTAKVIAASAAKQVNIDPATMLMFISVELNMAAINAATEKE